MMPTAQAPANAGERWRRGSMADRLPEQVRTQLFALGRVLSYPAGAILSEQGSRRPPVFLLLGGVVKGCRTAQPDSPPMLLNLFLSGDAPGTADAVLNAPGHVTYIATKATTALAIPRQAFKSFFEERSAAANVLAAVLARELQLRDRSLAYAPMPVEDRLIAFLERYSRLYGTRSASDEVHLDLGLAQADLAAAIGASAPSVAKVLNRLRDEGKVAIGYRSLFIKKPLAVRTPRPRGAS
ncbi:Crp/Fnr family transcriptional regulator [Saccharothrix sp. Mg75]|uniref:Crp/Fnr family transcriptional regulator n=1 Tax=Saccharothrix sp. Mg75 TaxID=3445357 RepID=UPI003EEEB31C